MKILTIDTADKDAAIILQKENALIDHTILENNKHTELLVPEIENMLLKNNMEYKDLDCISIVNGPGSFIGLKISVCVTKAIACIVPNIKIIKNNIFEIISYDKYYDFVVLEAGLEGFYIANKKNEYFYVKKDNFLPKKNDIIITNSIKVMDFLKEYNIIQSSLKKNTIISINYLKYHDNIFENKDIVPLYIREPQVNSKQT